MSIVFARGGNRDGEAIMQAFTTFSGTDCLKEIIPTYGERLKVYSAIKVKT